MKIKKTLLILISLSALFFKSFAAEFTKSCVPELNHYVLYVTPCDWGPVSSKVVICTKNSYKKEQINKKYFSVSMLRNPEGTENSSMGIKDSRRAIENVYLCNKNGEKTENDSNFIAIEFKIGPEIENGSPFATNVIDFINLFYGFRIYSKRLKILIETSSGVVCPQAAEFKINTSVIEENQYQYATWKPENKNNAKIPLIIFLHGISEGGQNPYLPLLGIKSTNLISPQIQQYFTDGAAVLVPQCPTSWLETTTKDLTGMNVWEPIDLSPADKILKPVKNTMIKIIKPVEIITKTEGLAEDFSDEIPESLSKMASKSRYTQILKEIINFYIEENPEIDRNRIFIGGCSAGGYMTLNMLLEYPDFFKAAFPVCEAYLDSKLSEDDIKTLSKVPLWFVHAKTDTTVKPEIADYATVQRIKAQNPKDLHYTLFDGIYDTTGLYKDNKGNPFEYSGHCCWIPVLNNLPQENGLTIFEWLSKR